MSNARLDRVFDATRQNMVEEYGEDAVNRATQYLKDRGYLWWDYWNYDVSGQSNLSQSDYDEIGRILTTKSTKKSQPTIKSINDMVKAQRAKNKNVKKTYPEDLTDEQAQTFEGYRLWANSIGEEIWEVVRSVTGMRSRCDMELDNLWKEVSDLLIQAKEKADALANIGIELN